MTWELCLWNQVIDDLKSLDKGIRQRVEERLRRLRSAPRMDHGLSGELAGCYSVEVARRYRIVYSLNQSLKEIEVIAVGKRENLEVYRVAVERKANRDLETLRQEDPEIRTAEPN